MPIFLLKWLPFLSKLSFFSKFLAFIPGGQVFALIGSGVSAVIGVFTWFIKWLMDDIICAVEKPQRIIVRLSFAIGLLAFGWWLGFDYAKDRVESARNETRAVTKQRDTSRAENKEWRERLAGEKDRADKAEVARAAAEARVRATAAKRLQQPGAGAPKAGGAAKKPAESGLPAGLQTLFGGKS